MFYKNGSIVCLQVCTLLFILETTSVFVQLHTIPLWGCAIITHLTSPRSAFWSLAVVSKAAKNDCTYKGCLENI